MCTPWASDWAVLPSDRAGFLMFRGSPVLAGAGMQFESPLGQSMTPRQSGFCFNVWTLTLRGSL